MAGGGGPRSRQMDSGRWGRGRWWLHTADPFLCPCSHGQGCVQTPSGPLPFLCDPHWLGALALGTSLWKTVLKCLGSFLSCFHAQNTTSAWELCLPRGAKDWQRQQKEDQLPSLEPGPALKSTLHFRVSLQEEGKATSRSLPAIALWRGFSPPASLLSSPLSCFSPRALS